MSASNRSLRRRLRAASIVPGPEPQKSPWWTISELRPLLGSEPEQLGMGGDAAHQCAHLRRTGYLQTVWPVVLEPAGSQQQLDLLKDVRQRRGHRPKIAWPAGHRAGARVHPAITSTYPRKRQPRQGTYSIVAFDPQTGAMGVAVQSHWFSVGSLVVWAQAGVGAVATQANVEVSYGPMGLEGMRAGAPASETLQSLVRADAQAAVRQVAMVDSRGETAAHTGGDCMDFAGHVVGEHHSCQANLMDSGAVWPAMSEAFTESAGGLTERLLDALDAGEAAGGDVRGRQSAAILVVPSDGSPWETIADLRVEDHPEPLIELRRLAGLHDAYVLAGEGDRLAGEGDHAAAAAMYVSAFERAPGCVELEFWAGLALVQIGDGDRGVAHLRWRSRPTRAGERCSSGSDRMPRPPPALRAVSSPLLSSRREVWNTHRRVGAWRSLVARTVRSVRSRVRISAPRLKEPLLTRGFLRLTGCLDSGARAVSRGINCQLTDRAPLHNMRLDEVPRHAHRKTPSTLMSPMS